MITDYGEYERKFNDNKLQPHLEFDGVRIIPPFIEFNDAFEGRTYKQKLHIRNHGKSKAFIRLIPPKSLSYTVKAVKGDFLSPGLCIVREVTFTYTHAAMSTSIMAIYINEKRCDYHLSGNTSAALCSISPAYIDFGMMDAGHASIVKTLLLENSGTKATRFFVDFTKSESHLIVDPNKGLLHAKSSVIVTIRVISSVEGKINIPLWIKCDGQFVVPVTGEVIKPKFEPINVNCTSFFALVDFPATYIGVKSVKSVFVRNYSAVGSMFCFMGEKDGKFMNLNTCLESNGDFKYFNVFPKDGRCEPKEVKAFRFIFKPVKPEKADEPKPFYFCYFYICRVRCKYLVAADYEDKVFEDDEDSISITSNRAPSVSASILLDSNPQDSSFIFKPLSLTERNYKEPRPECDCMKFFLHGIAENPSVNVVPDEFILKDLSVGVQQVRTLTLHNQSRRLPIYIGYKKVPCISLEKDIIYLTPSSSIEIFVYITSYTLGTVNTQIKFDLLYFDNPKAKNEYKTIGNVVVPVVIEVRPVTKFPPIELNKGITPNYIKEMGKFCENVTFNTPVAKPKTAMVEPEAFMKRSDALVAFPNDTRQSMRPWRSNLECKTIFKRFPRYIPPVNTDYELTAFDEKFKLVEIGYYTAYTRQTAKRLRLLQGSTEKLISEYDLTDKSKLMCTDVACQNSTRQKSIQKVLDELFMPLTAWQMNNIIVSPMVVHTGPIVSQRIHQFDIKIRNENSISISVYVKADKTNVIFPLGNRWSIKSGREVMVPIAYLAPTVGYYTTSLDLIVNACMVYVVAIFADVYTSHLKLSTDEIKFTDEETHYYLEIKNSLNADICFNWLLNSNNFLIEPLEGIVKQRSKLFCHVEYLPYKSGPAFAEVEFYSGDARPQEVRFIVTSVGMKLSFVNKEIVFQNIPLNMPVVRKALLMNKQNALQTFAVVRNDYSKYMKLYPSEGVVYGNSETIITIKLTMTSCVKFSTIVTFSIGRADTIDLQVLGNVVFPEISIIPRYIQFKKIASSSMAAAGITIENRSDAEALIQFDLHGYTEYKISESKNYWITDAEVHELTLSKHTSRYLFVHFIPTAVTSETFILPVIVNGILGPLDDNPLGKSTSIFLVNPIPDSVLEIIPERLPILKIHSYSMEPKLNISKRLTNLACRPSDKIHSADSEIKISNPQNEIETFCIRIDNLKPPLRLTYPQEANIIKYPQSIVCSLNPKEEVVLLITFEPTKFGTYQSLLPLIIKSDMSARPHNVLVVNGTFSAPTITTSSKVLYEKPLPLENIITALIEFNFSNHFDNCRVITSSDLQKLSTEVVEIICCEDYTKKVILRMVHEVLECGEYHSNLIVSCTCSAECKVTLIGCVENCFLTNYAIINTFLSQSHTDIVKRASKSYDVLQKLSFISELEYRRLSIRDTEYDITGFYMEYPSFPTEDQSLHIFMTNTAEFIEQWIYRQAFYGQCFYKIPEGINYVTFDKSQNDYQSSKKTSCKIPYIQLLINLVGLELEKYFDLHNAPSDDLGRACYCSQIYKSAIAFVKDQGAYLPYLQPHYLLEYSMYRKYVKHVIPHYPEQELFINTPDYDSFYNLSKQSWLDLLLQTYKVFMYYRIKKPEPGVKLKAVPHEKYQHSFEPPWMNSNIFSKTALTVLNWIDYHYNEMRKTLWVHNEFLGPRKVSFFGHGLEDGFVYSAVTLAYCPYLEKHFEELVAQPYSSEECMHNNIIVSRSWELLNFSIDVSPKNIVYSHAIANSIVMSYLFEVLPNMYPSETIDFMAGLSCVVTQELELKNPNDFSVAYKLSFIGNDDGCFSIDNDMHVIKAKGKCKIVASYQAKYIRDAECTLILNGECKGYHYAKSKVVTLKGKPNVQHATTTIKIGIPLHDSQIIDFTIKSPYSKNTSYRLQCTHGDITTAEDVNLIPYVNNSTTFNLARLMPLDEKIEFDENNSSVLRAVTITISTRTIPLWIFFRNVVKGDFAIKIIVEVTPPLRTNILTLVIPVKFHETSNEPVSKMALENIHLDIPCQNTPMWEAIRKYLMKAYKSDMYFWETIKNSSTGMHIIQTVIQASMDAYKLDLCQSTTYKISVQGTRKLNMPEHMVIENECSPGCVSIPVKFKSSKKLPKDFFFLMTSMNGQQIRRYKANLIYKHLSKT